MHEVAGSTYVDDVHEVDGSTYVDDVHEVAGGSDGDADAVQRCAGVRRVRRRVTIDDRAGRGAFAYE